MPEVEIDARTVNFEISDDVQKWIDKLQGLNGLAQEASKRQKELVSSLSDVDKRICDLAHYVEFCTLNACQGYKVAKKWHDLRCERREIKNELEVVSFILNKKITDSVSEEAIKLVDNINKRQYEPRVFKELFDV